MRIITEDNIDQLMNMSYSNNINKLLKTGGNKELDALYNKYKSQISQQLQERAVRYRQPSSDSSQDLENVPYADGSPAYNPNDSPAYNPNDSPAYNPNDSPAYNPRSPEESPPIEGIKIENEELKKDFNSLPERDKIMLMKMAAEQRAKKDKNVEENKKDEQQLNVKPQLGGQKSEPVSKIVTSILKVDEEKNTDDATTDELSGSGSGSGSETKSVSIDLGGSSDGVKQIIL
jgi:hypothetical protein